jgi:uncharacterized protein (TIGR02757 family)
MEPRLDLKAHLDRLYDTYGTSYLATDPIQFPLRYARDDDREIAAFVAAALAYGRVAQVHRSVGTILAYLGERPARRLRDLDPRRAARDLRGFAHRFNTGRDVACLLLILGRLIEEHGSLHQAFLAGFASTHSDVGAALADFCHRALETDVSPLARSGRVAPGAGVRFFFSSPEDGSTCKRLNLFLRWMVRRDAVDMGIWRGVPASHLVMPLDTHVARISRNIGLSVRATADWRMALEVTAALRRLHPEDPVRYDFAICRLGILDACPSRRDPLKCAGCGIRAICRLPAAARGEPAGLARIA